MMKSAIDWLMGKSESLTISNDLNPVPAHIGPEQETSHNDKDSPKENSVFNGHFSGGSQNRNNSLINPLEKPRRPCGEEIRSPWGRTLTPKSPRYISQISQKTTPSSSRVNSSHGSPKKMSSPISWDDMSFTSDVMSPGFATRIAKEARGGRKMYDGSRRYPVGQEKYIRTGILPNVRLKGRSKPVVMTRRAPTSPLLPLASPSSPFSSSSLASGFLASATTRMPDISSVVSVLDSTPSTSASDSIKDPTSVRAVVAALEQAQSLKSGIKRSRYGETEDSNKKQKCVVNSTTDQMSDFSTPIMNQAFNNGGGGAGGGGEKRALDLSPPISGEISPAERPQLSPENKRRCILDPRIASFSSSKNIANHSLTLQSSGRETPFSIYESHQDSDSESNKSLESHQSRQSERSYRGQNHDTLGGVASNQDQFDRSGSQTPQSLRGSYGIGGVSNGSSNSSRTTTPSRPSHVFSLEAHKADKAKSHQRLNKMLGMLFNVSDEEIQAANQPPASSSSASVLTNNVSVVSPVSSFPDPLTSVALSTPSPYGLLKEAFAKIQSDLPPSAEQKTKEKETSDAGGTDVSASFTFTLKNPKQSEAFALEESETNKPELSGDQKDATSSDSQPSVAVPKLPSYQDSIATSISSPETLTVSNSLTRAPTVLCNPSNLAPFTVQLSPSKEGQVEVKETSAPSKETSNAVPFLSFVSSSPSSTCAPSNPLKALKNTTMSINKSPLFSFGSSQPSNMTTASTTAVPTFTFEKPNVSTSENTIITTNMFSTAVSTIPVTSNPTTETGPKISNVFTYGAKNESSSPAMATGITEAVSGTDNNKSLLGNFSQSVSSSENKNAPKVSGLFTFGVSNSSNFNSKDKAPLVSETSQALPNPPFSFGANLPSNTTGTTMPHNTNALVSSIFTFGSSQMQTTTSNTHTVEMNTPPVSSQTISKVSNPDTGFSFNPSQSGANQTASSAATTSNSVFGSNNIFTFGSNTFKSPTAPQTLISTSSPTSGIFTFGDAPKPASQNSVKTPFQFSATTTSTTIPTPAFGSSIGGGFSFGGMKTTTPSTVPQFGATTTSTVPQFGATTTSTVPQFGPTTTSTVPHFGPTTTSTVPQFGPTTTSTVPQFGPTTTSTVPQFGPTTTSTVPQFGPTTTSTVPQFGPTTTSTVPQFGLTTTSTVPQFGPTTTSTVPQFGPTTTSTVPQFGPTTTSTVPQFGPTTTSTVPQFGPTTTSTVPQFGPTTTSTVPQFGPTTTSTVPQFGPTTTSTVPQFRATTTSTVPQFRATTTSTVPQFRATTPSTVPQFGTSPPSTVPQFGATTSISSSSTFTFNAASPKQPSGFEFSAPKTSSSTGTSNIFTFGSSNAQSSPFGTPTTSAGGGFGAMATPKAPTFNFGSEKTTIPTFGAQSPPTFGSPDIGNKSSAKPLFGGVDNNPVPAFGSTNTASPFGMVQTQNPFNAKSPAPAFGVFGSSKSENPPAVAPSASGPAPGPAPNQNPFQMGQNTNQSSTFAFGQPPSNSQPGVFLFGSQGNTSAAPTPNFGAGTFNFGTNNMGGGGTNIFTVGAASSDTPSAPRRPKARAHRRR